MQKNWKILLFSLTFMMFIGACKKNLPQYPTTYSNEGFMDYSKDFNKQLKDFEVEKIQDYIRNHKQDYLYTDAGVYMTRTNPEKRQSVKDFDTIQFQYQISNLQDSVLYNYKVNKTQNIVLGQSSIIPGLEYALKRMSAGEKAIVLVPSSLAYGVTGDGNKIGADEPLKIEIILTDIVSNEN